MPRFPALVLSLLCATAPGTRLPAGGPAEGIFGDDFETGDTRAWSAATVGPGGGRIVAAGGAVTLDFPPGALASGIVPTVSAVALPSSPAAVAGTFFDFGPNGIEFLEPVTVSIAYDPANVAAAQSDLRLVKLGSAEVLEVQPSAPADTVGHRVTGQLEGFSSYGIAGCGLVPPPVLSATYNGASYSPYSRSITLDWTLPPPLPPFVFLARATTMAGTPCAQGSSPYCVADGSGGFVLNGLEPPRAGDWTMIANLNGTSTTLTHYVPPDAAVYWYRIRQAYGPSSTCRTEWSAPIRVVVFGVQPRPQDPTSVTATPLPCGGAALTWSSVREASGYVVERAELGAGGYQTVASLAGTDLSYVDADSQLVPGATYRYRVRGRNASGTSLGITTADVVNSTSALTVGLSAYSLSIPPGGSEMVDVQIERHDPTAFDVELSAAFDLPSAISFDFQPDVTTADSTLSLDVDPAAGIGLRAGGSITATSLGGPSPGTSCSVPLHIVVRRPGCTLQAPADVVSFTPPETGIVDLQIDRWGFGGSIDLSTDGSLEGDGLSTGFVPNPTTTRSSLLLDHAGGTPPPAPLSGGLQATSALSPQIGCSRQIAVEVLAGPTLTVVRSGAGFGTVTSLNVPGIDCGVDCTETFSSSTLVGLQASPFPGSYVAGWQGCDDADGDICAVTVDGLRTVTAVFELTP